MTRSHVSTTGQPVLRQLLRGQALPKRYPQGFLQRRAMTLRSMLRSVAALCAAAALFVPARASAQGVTAGAKGGVNFANVSLSFNTANSATINPGNRTGGIAGGFIGIDKPKAGFLVEVLWSQKGTNIS